MDEKQLIDIITKEVIRLLSQRENQYSQKTEEIPYEADRDQELSDLTEREYKSQIQFIDPENQLALRAMRRATTARIGIGRSGCRLTTKALLSLRADHAMAKDAVLKNVDEKLLEDMHLNTIKSRCMDINEHLTRPDLGRQLPEESIQYIKENCIMDPQIQIYVSDGLSNSAVEDNIRDLLPILMDGLNDRHIKIGTPFFVKYGRVPTMDVISEVTGAEVTCVLLGERPGLAASDSMSAYITYGAYVGIPESKRTVVSNIHKNGIQPVEAGAYLVDVLMKILENKKSGVDLKM